MIELSDLWYLSNKSGKRISTEMPDHVLTSSHCKVLSTFAMLWKHLVILSPFPTSPPLCCDYQRDHFNQNHRHWWHIDFSIIYKENTALRASKLIYGDNLRMALILQVMMVAMMIKIKNLCTRSYSSYIWHLDLFQMYQKYVIMCQQLIWWW